MDDADVRLTSGARMAIRSRISPEPTTGPRLTDTVGDVVAVDDGEVVVVTRHGHVVLDRSLVVAARVIPPRPTRRGAPHRAITLEDLERVMTKGNPGLEVGWLGEPGRGWMLRAGGGYTGRANSALPLGDPGMTDEAAVAAVTEWYQRRDLVPLIQVPLPSHVDWTDDPFASSLVAGGWRRLRPTLVMTGRSEGLAGLPVPDGLLIESSPRLTDEWLATASPVALAHPEAARAVLSAPREQAFLLARSGGAPVGVARVALDDGWAGVFGVHVPAAHRRQGIGAALTATAGRLALDRGVSLAYLQVEEGNSAAVALYERAGMTTHHHYAYLCLD